MDRVRRKTEMRSVWCRGPHALSLPPSKHCSSRLPERDAVLNAQTFPPRKALWPQSVWVMTPQFSEWNGKKNKKREAKKRGVSSHPSVFHSSVVQQFFFSAPELLLLPAGAALEGSDGFTKKKWNKITPASWIKTHIPPTLIDVSDFWLHYVKWWQQPRPITGNCRRVMKNKRTWPPLKWLLTPAFLPPRTACTWFPNM